MSKEKNPTHPLMQTVPRGVSTKRLSEQTAPMGRFTDPWDVLASTALEYDPYIPGSKILIGKVDDKLVGIEDERHIITAAGNRSGKTVTAISNLLNYPGSVICTDSKGELAEKSAQRRAEMGQKVVVLDGFNVVKGAAAKYRASFNPMTILKADNPYVIEDALQITDGVITSTGDEKDPHWNESASHFIMGIILLVALSPHFRDKDRNLITVRKLINRALTTRTLRAENPGEKDIHYYELLQLAQDCEAALIEQGYEDIAEEMMGAVRGFYEKGTDERGSVLSTVRRHTHFLTFRSMKNVLTGHDVDLADLKREKCGVTIYLVLPATKMGMCNRWLRLILNQFLDAMELETSIPEVPVLAVLDEFPVLGYMKVLENAAGQIASFGVKLWVIMQDWGQGKALYKERWESFAANAGIIQFFANVDLTTTEYISKKLGQTIIQATRKSETTLEQRAKGLKGELDNMQQTPLMSPGEIERTFSRNDPQKRQLVFWAGYSPVILERYEYFRQQ